MLPGKIYHVYNHANGGENLFINDENYRFFLEKYRKYIVPIADTYAYNLLPNHIHFMIRLKEYEEISKVLNQPQSNKPIDFLISRKFADFFSSYTQSFNKIRHRMGSLFMQNFKRKEIVSDSYFTAVILYIHLNAVKHGIVKKITDWKWSSYNAILDPDPDPGFLESKTVLDWFGGVEGFIRAHLALQEFKTLGEL